MEYKVRTSDGKEEVYPYPVSVINLGDQVTRYSAAEDELSDLEEFLKYAEGYIDEDSCKQGTGKVKVSITCFAFRDDPIEIHFDKELIYTLIERAKTNRDFEMSQLRKRSAIVANAVS